MGDSSFQIVHGFGVASFVFRPMLARLRRGSTKAALFRYPSVGLSLQAIVDRLCRKLSLEPPNGIVAHSLGCVVTILAAQKTGWTGPIAFLAPPFSPLPVTTHIPSMLRFPFAPLLDLRSLLSDQEFRLPALPNCPKLVIAGRFDCTVPLRCTRSYSVDEYRVVLHTHNSLLISPSIADACFDWIATKSNR
jgi:hypothetical protein